MKKFALVFAFMLTEIENLIVSCGGGALPQIFRGRAESAVRKSTTLYVAGLASELAAVNGSTLRNIVKKIASENNIGSNHLQKDTSFLAQELAVVFQDAGEGITLKTATWDSEPPAAFLNGEFKIEVKGTGICFEAPGNDIGGTKFATTGNEDIFRPISPVLFKSEKEFDLIFNTVGAYNGFYKILLRGEMYTKPSSN